MTDELESHKEEFAFMESKVQRVTRELAEQEAGNDKLAAEGAAKDARIAALEAQVSGSLEGDGGGAAAAAAALLAAKERAEELERQVAESAKTEDELREGLAHQQAVHEALSLEAGIGQEVLKETMKTLEAKTAAMDALQADLNDKTSEARELSEKLDALLADLDHCNKAKEDMRRRCVRASVGIYGKLVRRRWVQMRAYVGIHGHLHTHAHTNAHAHAHAHVGRRHEALIDDRESVELAHQTQMDEMMGELKKRQDRIAALEKDVEESKTRASRAEHRLSVEVEKRRSGGGEEAGGGAAAAAAGKVKELEAALQAKDSEAFEMNFEIKGVSSKLKLMETERDELEASLGEVAHARDDLQARADKLAAQLAEAQGELESAQEEAGKLMAEVAAQRTRVLVLEEDKSKAAARAEAAEAAARSTECSRAAAGAEAAELAGLKTQMEGWLEDMRVLKAQEVEASRDAAAKGKALEEAVKAREGAEATVANLQAQVEELNAINTKLIGHSNAQQKVQHVVKMKEENNELHAALKKAQGDMSRLKAQHTRLEAEVDKLRAAVGVEGGAKLVLEEEERQRKALEAKDAELQALSQQMEALQAQARDVAAGCGGAAEELGEAPSVGAVLDTLGRRMLAASEVRL